MGHDHDHATRATGTGQRRRLTIVLAITVTVLVAEVIGAGLTGSLALLADAGHMLTDAAGLVMALLAAPCPEEFDKVMRTGALAKLSSPLVRDTSLTTR